ncbi:hypothetical protein BDW75DRAFT_204829 [Aspergillus navahoensis]
MFRSSVRAGIEDALCPSLKYGACGRTQTDQSFSKGRVELELKGVRTLSQSEVSGFAACKVAP